MASNVEDIKDETQPDSADVAEENVHPDISDLAREREQLDKEARQRRAILFTTLAFKMKEEIKFR